MNEMLETASLSPLREALVREQRPADYRAAHVYQATVAFKPD